MVRSRSEGWTVPRDWPGEVAVILAGGPSVLNQDLSPLAGRRVIAINSAWHTYPKADVLFGADARWWREFKPGFPGLCISTGPTGSPRVKVLEKVLPDRLATDPGKVALRKSSVTGAINIAVHFGAAKIVLLGVDGRLAPDGKRHNHGEVYPWALRDGCFAEHAAEFRQIAGSVPVPVINCSPVSDLDVWPRMTLEDAL